MNIFVIDAYAWVEYFDGTSLGEKVRKIVENDGNTIYTNVITIAELSSHFQRKGNIFEEARKIILSLSLVYNVSLQFAEEAGKNHAIIRNKRKHMGLADVFVLQTARKLKAKVVTGDEDFRGLPEVIMIK
ncbi:MAG TPA: PIN domain-containing protein [Candidatus Nanoarchaeia archaeon]|nr:PIN domain-containing protein [Candidatus Nanoarchaeia archaeon]